MMAPGLAMLAVGCGIMAGVYFAFSAFVMRSLGAMPPAKGIAAMQSINRRILSSLFMPLFFATSLASLIVAAWATTRWGHAGTSAIVVAGALYVVGMFVCTAAFNVPLNEELDRVDPSATAANDLWAHYLRRWTLWNHVRTVSSAGACALFLAAANALR